MSLDFIDDQSALVQIMAWCRQATSITWANVDPDLCRHMVSLGHNELRYVSDGYPILQQSSWLNWHCLSTPSAKQFINAHPQRAKMYLKDILKTSLQGWSSRCVLRLKNVNPPVVLMTYFQCPQDQYSRRLAAQAWRPFQGVKYCLQHVFIVNWPVDLKTYFQLTPLVFKSFSALSKLDL